MKAAVRVIATLVAVLLSPPTGAAHDGAAASSLPATSTIEWRWLLARLPHAIEAARSQIKPGVSGRYRVEAGVWKRRTPVEGSSTGGHSWAASATMPRGPSGEFSTTVWKTFYRDGDSLSFTTGRSPEECNEAPRIIWESTAGEVRRAPLPALYDFNVASVWMTRSYLIFGLEADYELGSHAERLAFWNLDSGDIVVTPKVHWESEEWDGQVRKVLFHALSSWRGATVAEDRGRIILRAGKECVQIWPADRKFAPCQSSSVK